MSKVLTPEEIKEIWAKALSIADLPLDDEENFNKVKDVVCNFYSSCPDIQKPISIGGCSGCNHNDSFTLAGCRDEYLKWIYLNPMNEWSIDFTKPLEVEKVSMSERQMGLKCDVCHVSVRCPQFKPGHLCSIDWGEDTNPSELSNKEIINRMIDLQLKRVNRETMFEDIEGGKTDPTVSSEMDRLTGLVAHRNNLDTRTAKLTIEASETSNNESSNSSGGSLLASLFGGKSSNENALPSDSGNTIPLNVDGVQEAEVIETKQPTKKENKKSRRSKK